MQSKNPHIVCFGEVLWDNLPSGKKPGGAPMNVAYHLTRSGVSASLISRVGHDANGKELLQVLHQLDLNTTYCQVDDLQSTSTVEVVITPDNEVTYDIVFPVAWDYIQYENRFEELIKKSDAFVFGSLAGRNEVTRATLNKLLNLSAFNVFDVNLRPPFYEQAYITSLLAKTNLLKLNLYELNLLTGWYGDSDSNEPDKVRLLQEKFAISEIIVTKGGKGASYYKGGKVYHSPAYQIAVKDTVGSGDSFLAAFLSKQLMGETPEHILEFASAVAAFVTTQAGACPPYTPADVKKFIDNTASLKTVIS
ncbi:carbohydrate kinase [Pedobacter sp. BS3]|uniref:carbohydrate kinase family protein n=1 Tax=Pedobacter sp. BS3 TaxID=2567937 RepID=UPI0011EDF456|nr:carbohydrate kinase [Pedobacter sp. BS3]TZF83784.1 carbohydrate kinase [Pedobacter sp. BS3]